ncbi:MAG: hypothetical protein M5U34_05380 [Chloroflexi bacterium]|nr:hypothetical protein [Chloroflexota bacterium]
MLPGDGELPSFSAYGCLENVDDLVAYAPAEDISLLNTVLAVLSFLPTGVLRWLVGQMSAVKPDEPGLMAPLYRQLNFGLRGIIFSLYYGRKRAASTPGRSRWQ